MRVALTVSLIVNCALLIAALFRPGWVEDAVGRRLSAVHSTKWARDNESPYGPWSSVPVDLEHVMGSSDKRVYGGGHGYVSTYKAMFLPVRMQVRRLLEIGIGTRRPGFAANMGGLNGYVVGASLRGWRDFFPHASVLGLDIDPAAVVDYGKRITARQCNTTNPSSVHALALPTASYDIIIDDGLVRSRHTRTCAPADAAIAEPCAFCPSERVACD